MTENKIFDDIKESETYKNITEKMSDEERALADRAALELLKYFQDEILAKLQAVKSTKKNS